MLENQMHSQHIAPFPEFRKGKKKKKKKELDNND
jgi:hypothetical protein